MNHLIIRCIRGYQGVSRALIALRFPLFIYSGCRSVPTCSEYTILMVQERGWLRGVLLGAWRVLRCNPLARPSGV